MKRFILVLLTFSNFYCVSAQTSTYLSEIITKWENARKYTLEIAELMPDSAYNFSPTKEEMTFAQQIVHIQENMTWLSRKYLMNDDSKSDKLKADSVPKKEIISNLKTAFNNADNILKTLKPENLDEKVDFFAGRMTKRQIINLMNDHLTHHNAQCLVYLRLKGISPPKYIGW
jgi:uncharacterized damage-inducible protein DinB